MGECARALARRPGLTPAAATTDVYKRQGKTRLTAEFLGGIDATQLRGRCLSYGEGITYWPVITMVKQLLDLPGAEAAALMERDGAVLTPIRALLGDASRCV